MSKQLKAALALASRGLSVFPITPHKKFPPLVAWKSMATTDQNIITDWWTQWSDCNIGVATGKKSGVWVFDVDMKKGKNGEAELRRLEKQHGKLPATVESITPHGGRQIWFKMPDNEVKCSVEKIGGGLDVKGDGGYVLAPPSFVSDDDGAGGYIWSVDCAKAFAEAPRWLLEATGACKAMKTDADWLRISRGVPDGSRNEDAASLAGKLARVPGFKYETILNLMLGWDRTNVPPLGSKRIKETVDSICAAEADRRVA
jgi:Bifunctional DNA primase/polymerase, N-terminal